MIKIDVFHRIDDLSHIGSFKQLFHCRNSIIIMTDINKRSAAYSSRKCFTLFGYLQYQSINQSQL